ncbi:hypothetical protein [Cupriavidus taiwanensis]|uniref:Uncharacterized protein n=1 Tax=Cupriavidus taiwanensis TaxID=164546 RepID=A0A975X3V1_9BURK|nr:hypothetical protein CBM2587_A80010 [Cupriavidus taiwanensis]
MTASTLERFDLVARLEWAEDMPPEEWHAAMLTLDLQELEELGRSLAGHAGNSLHSAASTLAETGKDLAYTLPRLFEREKFWAGHPGGRISEIEEAARRLVVDLARLQSVLDRYGELARIPRPATLPAR